jgi:hypothetical protein
MKYKAIFLFCCTIFAGATAFCQDSAHLAPKLFPKTVNLFSLDPAPVTTQSRIYILSPNYYASHLGFFCKEEINIEKATKIPFKFRLGSVAECDWLEGKTQVDR